MSANNISGQIAPPRTTTPSGGSVANATLSPLDTLASVVANRADPRAQGEALRSLDQQTGDRTATDRLVENARVGPPATDTPQVSSGAQTTPVTLTAAQKQVRIQAALPAAIAIIRAASVDPTLTAAERADLAASATTLARTDTHFAYGAIPNQPHAVAAAEMQNNRATITLNLGSVDLFKPNGTVDTQTLATDIAHEARHIHDDRAYHQPNGPSTIAEVRRTERNAYRTEAALAKVTGLVQNITDPTGQVVQLTAATANYAAEGSVKSWVGAAAISARATNSAIDRSYATYLHQLAAYNHANHTQVAPQPRQAHVPVPTYRPPASY